MSRKLGMTREDIERLYYLRPGDFPPGEWAVLNYAREWTLARGGRPGKEVTKSLEENYSKREIGYFHKLLNMMIFANYFSNRFLSRKSEGVDACRLPGFMEESREK